MQTAFQVKNDISVKPPLISKYTFHESTLLNSNVDCIKEVPKQ